MEWNIYSSPSAVIDATDGKLLVVVSAVTPNGTSQSELGLFRCDLDATGCMYGDLSAGQGACAGGGPQALIDTVNSRLLVVISNYAEGDQPGLFSIGLW